MDTSPVKNEGLHEGPQQIRDSLEETLGRITEFWGFKRIMGRLYGLLYLSTEPLTLEQMAEGLKVSKASVSVNIRALQRWNMVRKVLQKGDRRDFYLPLTDFLSTVKGVMQEREQREFSHALENINVLGKRVSDASEDNNDTELLFMKDRLLELEKFISNIDRLVALFLPWRTYVGFLKSKHAVGWLTWNSKKPGQRRAAWRQYR